MLSTYSNESSPSVHPSSLTRSAFTAYLHHPRTRAHAIPLGQPSREDHALQPQTLTSRHHAASGPHLPQPGSDRTVAFAPAGHNTVLRAGRHFTTGIGGCRGLGYRLNMVRTFCVSNEYCLPVSREVSYPVHSLSHKCLAAAPQSLSPPWDMHWTCAG